MIDNIIIVKFRLLSRAFLGKNDFFRGRRAENPTNWRVCVIQKFNKADNNGGPEDITYTADNI